MNPLTIVVPNRQGEKPAITIESLYRQTWQKFDVIIVNDTDGNANKARNTGLKMVSSEFILFSDNDINWAPGAIETMFAALESNTWASYSYGWYQLDGRIWCRQEWDEPLLRRKNYISTMSMVRTAHHPGWDETIKRLQDWDVWLTMLARGKKGVYTGQKIFDTAKRNGITYAGIGWDEALKTIQKKHNL